VAIVRTDACEKSYPLLVVMKIEKDQAARAGIVVETISPGFRPAELRVVLSPVNDAGYPAAS